MKIIYLSYDEIDNEENLFDDHDVRANRYKNYIRVEYLNRYYASKQLIGFDHKK